MKTFAARDNNHSTLWLALALAIIAPIGLVSFAPGAAQDKPTREPDVIYVPTPNEVAPQQPLLAQPKPQLAADLVAQQLGLSRRDRTVRFVHAKQNDSLDVLVRRWCGARDPFLAEAKSLNEDLVVLRVGQEVAVPWVDDEVVLAALEAQKPKTLAATDGTANAAGAGKPVDASATGGASPSFHSPGAGLGANAPRSGDKERDDKEKDTGSRETASKDKNGSARSAPVAAGSSYTIKSGDSLWKIAETAYGKKNASRMIEAIKQANDGLDADRLQPGRKIALPAGPSGG